MIELQKFKKSKMRTHHLKLRTSHLLGRSLISRTVSQEKPCIDRYIKNCEYFSPDRAVDNLFQNGRGLDWEKWQSVALFSSEFRSG